MAPLDQISQFRKQCSPIAEAENALMLLYKWKREHSSEVPTWETFYPVDLDRLVLLLGFTVDRVESVGYVDGLKPVEAQTNFKDGIIGLGVKDQTPGRINFTLAHEIGHIFLHRGLEAPTLLRVRSTRRKGVFQSAFTRRCDAEADRFSSELLMPRRAVRRCFYRLFGCSEMLVGSHTANDIIGTNEMLSPRRKLDKTFLAEALSKHASDKKRSLVDFFGVSVKAMRHRLLELRLVVG